MTSAQPALAPLPSHAASEAREAQHQQRLERLGRAIERQAARQGLEVEFLGVEPLFAQPRLYGEGARPWVLCPAAADPLVLAGLPIPVAQRRKLDAVVKAGLDFPHLYLAHELAKDPTHRPAWHDFENFRTLTDVETKQLLVRPEAPAAARRTAERVDQLARTVGRGIGLAASGAAMAVVAPLALLASGLDPAVLGALTLPATGHTPGTPAAWFLLARWDW